MRPKDARPRRLLVSGSTGLIGRSFVAARRAAGDTVVRLVRGGAPAVDAVFWNPGVTRLEPASVSGFDAVIHLAGEPVAGRWTAEKKSRIKESRVQGTAALAAALAGAERPPKVFVCASGINFYGSRGDAVVDETSPQGEGFLPEVCAAWEQASASLAGVSQVVNLRIGVVLAKEGGTLALMLPLFRRGLGGTVGGGRGYLSWVTLRDVVRAVEYVVEQDGLSGPVNVVAPEAVTGAVFTKQLAAVGWPAVIPVPAWAARLAMGEMAEETVLGSVWAVPRRLLDSGFRFRDETIAAALVACGVSVK